MLQADTPVQFLKGVGPQRADAFARLGVRTVEDLLYHIPHRYLDATTVTPIAKATVGMEVTLVGRVVSKGVVPTRRRLRIFRAVLRDSSGVIECAWPGQAFLDRSIKPGQLLLVTGPVKYYHGRQVAPREQIVLADAGEGDGEGTNGQGLVLPVYPATEGLTHRQVRRIVAEHLEAMLAVASDSLPESLRREAGVATLDEALRALHRPTRSGEWEQGRRRLALDELFDLQLVVSRARHLAKSAHKGPRFALRKTHTSRLKDTLPFDLTADQKRAVREITADMIGDKRMHRLLMGDVGTGKTVVALFAMLLAVENDYQAVVMAPTELLTEQHGRTLTEFLAPLGIMPEILLGRLSPAEKAAIRGRIADGGARVIVGTHALFQEQTDFQRLGLVVIDEQHRFGVEQRAALIEKGEAPDVLLLSATPIPRTLALTLYGDLDISTLKQKPKGQRPVKTGLRTGRDRQNVYAFLKERCQAGRQAYVVYPVIDESEKVDLKAATTMAEQLKGELAPLTVDLVHGRMKGDERDAVMRAFRDGVVDVLVATTVIEVGIDVPNATVMVIEHPERFGLAQLHQLRGRVGRGADESHCVLLSDVPEQRSRLQPFARTTDGFKIAELDLKDRGMGELAGTRQAGGINLRFTDLERDDDLVLLARRAALALIGSDPSLSGQANQPLRRRVERRYERGIELFRVG
ncbi:MAG: ATP-dependent DNA helicase RecG [Gemmatimonadota bacterium]|nr:ATP-dependent DNA helicase RecG [Gemmatimonadota bacterium]MDH3369083.1 ATP-dependent DNA helicase RecG [Gemmatimonadota bacterium]MDH3477831.1 ATP-dependent DNA helicase RecG [Gemmatimonadota bacterium]MDH3570012.1 ATP-dependent DNA helicase RecG [Gemmatimonadota bacterium]MDH5549960.1 ATP-dependent DNA helicase RecG [Gemmatimonadota bacterium]